MSNLLQQLKQRVLSTDSRIIDREIELWANLYALTRQQQQFAHAMRPSLKQLNSPHLMEAEQIIEQESLLIRTQGVLLSKLHDIQDPAIKKRLTQLLND